MLSAFGLPMEALGSQSDLLKRREQWMARRRSGTATYLRFNEEEAACRVWTILLTRLKYNHMDCRSVSKQAGEFAIAITVNGRVEPRVVPDFAVDSGQSGPASVGAF